MSKHIAIAAALVTVAIVATGCAVNVNPKPQPTVLLSVTGRSITDGQALAFVFTPEADRRVNISVQASTDRANPDFRVVRGAIDYEDLNDTPISGLVLISADQGSGQEINHFTPETAEAFTLFVEDANDWPEATFSVTVTQ